MKKAIVVALLGVVLPFAGDAAPFAENIQFTQPDGTEIVLFGEGDEFYAVFETLDGYTVVFNQLTKAYDYAQLSADGSTLTSSGLVVGSGDPKTVGVVKHLRINQTAIKKQVKERFSKWDQEMEVTARWSQLKAVRRQLELSKKDGIGLAPPAFTSTGTKVGLTLLVDFDDDPATISQADIIDYCNGDNYAGYGNNGSIKKYFQDNSGGLLTYSNVVTIYIRAPQPKTYYNDTAVSCGTEGRKLLADAINTMKALPNYATEILPTLEDLTVDDNSRVVACNVFFAGANSGVWSHGLWAHSSSLTSAIDLGNGKMVYKYQLSNIGTSLALKTFCHENGHMLCGFPDIYDYDYDSSGGAGSFCLMGSGVNSLNPAQICAYLKRASGWAAITELTNTSSMTASLTASTNHFYRYTKPGVSTEYFIIENRQKTGRDASLAASGIAIWHIDELGDRDNQSTNCNSSHLNYEVSLMQADNLWHFQKYQGSGDPKDLYYNGNAASDYRNQFTDSSSPSARWWDGTGSGLNLYNFSTNAMAMSFSVETSLATSVLPTGGAVFRSASDGSFVPASWVYTVSNASGESLDWTITRTQSWVTLTSAGGTLPGGGSSDISVSINGAANELSAGIYTDTLIFSNSLSSVIQTRTIELKISKPTNITIEGAARLAAHSTNLYSCTAWYSDGSSTNVAASWSLIGDTHGTELSANGALSVGDIPSDATVTIQAIYAGTTNTWPVSLSVIPYGILAAWDFYGTPSPSPSTVTATVYAASSAPGLSRVGLSSAGRTNHFFAWNFTTNSTLAEAVSANKYFAFTLSNNPVEVIDVSMCIGRIGSSAPTSFTLRVSSDAGFGTYTDRHVQAYTYNTLTATDLNISGPSVYFRLYGYGASSNGLSAGFAGTTNSGASPANSGLDGTPYDLIVYGHGSALSVTPGQTTSFRKFLDEPIAPSTQIYTVSNASGAALNWAVTNTQDWVAVTPSGGTLAWGESATLIVSNTAAASALPPGTYTNTLVFSNSLTSEVQTRSIELKIGAVTNIAIQGASRLLPYSTNFYACQAQYLDGTSSNVTDLATWSLIGSGATLSSNVLSAGNIVADSVATLQAVYGGVTNTCSVTLTAIPAGVLAAWDFYGLSGIPAPGAVTAVVYTVNSSPVITRVGLTSSGSTNKFRATGFPTNQTMDEAVSAGKYFTFTLTNTTSVAVADVSMSIYRSGLYSPTGFTLRVSSDVGFSTYTERHFQAGNTAYNNNIRMSNLNVFGTSVYFRLYGYGSSNNYFAGFAGTTNSGTGAANSGLDGTLYDLIVYGHGAMTVTPLEGSSFVKISDDPVVPLSRIYTVSNATGASIDWTASYAQPWITATPSNGILEAGGSTNVSVSISVGANELPVGVYEDSIVFRNSTDSMIQNRSVQLRVIKATDMAIDGSTRLAAYSTNYYTCRAHYTDGSTSNVTDAATWSLIGSGAAMNGNALSVDDIASDSTVTVQAVYDGLTNTYPVMLKFIPPGLTPLGTLFTNVTSDAQAIVYSNGYVYVACGYAGVIIFDVSTSTNIVKVGGYDTGGFAAGLTLYSNLLFVADGNSDLMILNVNNPSNPVPSGRWKSDYDPAYVRKIVISGQHAYLAAGSRGLLVLDISNISVPRLVAEYDTDNAWGVTATGQYAYVADHTNGLKIIDISTPTNPVFAGFYPIDGSARDVAVRDGYAYVVAYTNGLQVINVSSPTNPVYAAGYVTNYCSGIVLDGDFAYMANGSSGLGIVNINNPAAPSWSDRFDDNKGTATGVFVADGKAFVANGYGGIQIVNVSDLSLLGSYDTHRHAYDVAVKGSYAYLAGYRDGLITVDISDPNVPRVVATNKWSTGTQYAYGVDIVGDYLYVAPSGGFGLIVYDISNPALPSLVASYDFVSIGSIVDVKTYSNYAYCANSYFGSTNALAVVDVSNPGDPVYVSGYNTGGAAYNVEVQGPYAYLASGTNGLQIFDISNAPNPPDLKGSYSRPPVNEFETTSSSAYGVAVSGDYVYLLDSGVTLEIINVSDRQTPKLEGLCNLGRAGSGSGIFIQYPYVFIAYDTGFQMPERNGLWVVDVSDPANPVVVADYPTSGYSRGVTANNGHVYLADDSKGLHTFTWGAVPTPAKSVTNFVVYRFAGGSRLEILSAKTTNSYEGYVEYSDRSLQSVSTSAVWTVVGEPQGAVFNENQLIADGVTSNGAVITVQGSFLGFSDTLAVTLYYDRNINGIPDWWELQYSGGITGMNPDGICSNGFNTWREAYIAGLNPNDPQSQLLISNFRPLTVGNALNWNPVSGRVYNVYWTTNLMNGFQCLESNILWPRGSFTNAIAVPSGFYKIDVRLQ